MRGAAPLAGALLAAALLGATWVLRRDPLDLGVLLAGLLGLGLLLRLTLAGDGRGRLALRVLASLLSGVAIFGVREPTGALLFAAVFFGSQMVMRWLVRRM
ncbi:hypothetical protein L1280_001322 [Deinococcus sp. HSC-46F16]|uniref:hypothetical protein n=1 Tax=Deinococcus sp. HSC-46F16 TaxID=2910968 RepID=UPI0020A220A0|nr:hypothetical protein [Deinococcus sp. HSC-46F16]MCP2014185.1 hypothetical protein [Deinococcus sp. HSC-46F16]